MPRGSTRFWVSPSCQISRRSSAPIPQSTVLSRVAEFVTDHRSTFPSFDTTIVTDANNFFVLDFVLFLEYIESAFYDLNVPLFT